MIEEEDEEEKEEEEEGRGRGGREEEIILNIRRQRMRRIRRRKLNESNVYLSRHLRRLLAVYDVRNKSSTLTRTTAVDGTTIVAEQLPPAVG